MAATRTHPASSRRRSRAAWAGTGIGLVALCTVASACPASPNDDAQWEVGLDADEDVGALMSVWGPSPDDVYVVGGQPATSADGGFGVMFHFDGRDWSRVSLPADTPMLNWVFGSDEQVVAVGEAGTVLRSRDGGQSFESFGPAGITDPLWGVWGPSDDELWAVGGDPFVPTSQLLHYRNGSWTELSLPALDRPEGSLFKVWGTDAEHVWVVGDAGIVLSYDGQAWQQQLAGTTSDLVSLWGTGPNEVAAIGGRANGTLARFDGSSWSSEVLAGLPGLNGMWMGGDGAALIGGVFGTLAELPAGSSTFERLEFSVNPLVIHAVYGFDDGSRFAVGGSLDRSPPYIGVIAQRVGGT